MKYLKYFETEAAYASYKNGSDYVLPNVSFVEETTGVKFNSFIIIPNIPEGYTEFITADGMVFSAYDDNFYVKL